MSTIFGNENLIRLAASNVLLSLNESTYDRASKKSLFLADSNSASFTLAPESSCSRFKTFALESFRAERLPLEYPSSSEICALAKLRAVTLPFKYP